RSADKSRFFLGGAFLVLAARAFPVEAAAAHLFPAPPKKAPAGTQAGKKPSTQSQPPKQEPKRAPAGASGSHDSSQLTPREAFDRARLAASQNERIDLLEK